jgi:hypothetical protein
MTELLSPENVLLMMQCELISHAVIVALLHLAEVILPSL